MHFKIPYGIVHIIGHVLPCTFMHYLFSLSQPDPMQSLHWQEFKNKDKKMTSNLFLKFNLRFKTFIYEYCIYITSPFFSVLPTPPMSSCLILLLKIMAFIF